MSAHSFKSSFGQCQCRWCGQGGSMPDCPVTTEMRRWLGIFATEHGRTWKSQLRELWLQGKDDGLARQIRNVISTRQLDKITSGLLKRLNG